MDRAFHGYLRRPTRRRLARLIRESHALVWQTALRATGSREDADDIAQDVFLDLLLRPPSPASVSSPRGYLVWKVVGRVLNLERAEARRKARERRGRETAISDGLAAEDLEALRAAVADLPGDLRAPIEMRYFGGLANREIAAVLETSERNVEKRLQRAREILRSRLARLSGVALLLERDGAWAVPGPAAALLSSLLSIARRGGALAASAGTSSLGGSLMAKKMALAAGIAAACALGGIVSSRVFLRGGTGKPPEAVTALRGISPPEVEAGKVPVAPPESGAQDLEPARPAFASLHGVLLDPEDRPLVGARVLAVAEIAEEEAARLRELGFPSAAEGLLELETTSDEEGGFRLEDLLPTSLRLYVRSETAVCCWPRLVRLAPGEEHAMRPDLCWAHALSGRITDAASGLAIPAAAIVVDATGAVSLLEARVAKGGFEASIFPADGAGRYETGFGLVLRRGSDTDPLRVTATAPGYAARTLLVRSDEFQDRRATLDFALEPEWRALVRVADASGQPIAGARVMLDHEHLFLRVFWPSTRTDAGGEVVLDRLAPQRYSLHVKREGYRDSSATLEADRPRDAHVAVVLERILPPVRGKIAFDPHIPRGSRIVPSVWLEATDARGFLRQHHGACDEEKLTYTIHPPGPGAYRLAHRFGGGPKNTGESFHYDAMEAIERDILISFESPYIAGRAVRAETAEGITHLDVSVAMAERGADPWADHEAVNGFRFPAPGGTELPCVKTDEQGRFLVPLPGRDPWNRTWTTAIVRCGSREGGWAPPRVLEYDGATAIDDLVLEVEPPAAIEGAVIGADGMPAWKEVVAAWNGRETVEHAVTGEDGTYRIGGLPPGDYLVLPVGKEDFRPFGPGVGPSTPLPAPEHFFELPVRLAGGGTVRIDLDLARDSLGRIEAVLPEGIDAAWIAYGMLAGGRVARRACLGGQEPLEKGRPAGPLFGIREHLLLPGSYRVWLEDGDGRRLSEAVVEVRRAWISTAVLPLPDAALAIPVALPAGLKMEGVEIARIVAFDAHAPDPSRPWVEWGGFSVLRAGGALRIERLPPLRVRALLHAPGYRETWSHEADFGSLATLELDPVVLERGATVRIELRLPAGVKPPETMVFRVHDLDDGRRGVRVRARPGEHPGVWLVEDLPPGRFSLSADPGPGFQHPRIEITVEGSGVLAEVLDLLPKG